MKHAVIGFCGHCEQDLKKAHPVLVQWFYWVKALHLDAHICWAFRDREDQDMAFEKGLSKLKWPESKHNALDTDGNPCSRALDVFQIKSDGKAYFDVDWCAVVNEETKKQNFPIKWGGDFKTLKDFDHFEMIG